MEVAGVVLGGIPIVLWALENYKKALNPARDYWRYESTLSTIKMNIFIQQEQLDATLHNIGLHGGASLTEVELHLRRRYPGKCDTFMNVLGHMDEIVQKLMDNLDIDANGKPKWEEIAPGRVKWEWRRVKRSFGRYERQSLIDELQHWNNALKNCFERQEIPSDEGDRTVKEVQARFDPNQCDAVRNNAKTIHEAIQSGWDCVCPHPHCGILQLEWHNNKVLTPSVFNLAFSYRKAHNGQPHILDECWQKILIKIEEAAEPAPASLASPAVAVDEPTGRHPSPSRRARFGRLFYAGSTDRRHSPSSCESSMASAIIFPPHRAPTPPLVSGLCELMQRCTATAECLGYFPDPNSSPSRRIQIHNTAAKPSLPKMVPVRSFLFPSNQQPLYQLGLSRKQRFGIAASLVWAVLFLCDSPWLSEKLDRDEIQLMVDTGDVQMQHEPTRNTYVFHRFFPPAAAPASSASLSAADQFQDCQIRNKTLFALGILLIELCLNRSFGELRHESQIHNQSLSGAGMGRITATATVSEDYAIAATQTDKVYLEAGYLYGYAVQRCLRCEFLGRDVTKNFQFQQFRTDFVNGVVAPIQATFASIPASCAAF